MENVFLENVIINNATYGYCRVNITIGNGIILNCEIIEKNCNSFCTNDFLVTSGFVNGHLHPNQLLDRRLMDGLDTHSYLHKMHIDFEKTYEDRYSQALFVLMDAIKSGATSIYSVASHPMPVIDAYKAIGVKGAVSCFFNDQWETSDKAPKIVSISEIEENFKEFLSHKTDKLDIHIGAASIRASSDNLLVFLNNLAEKYKTKVNIHLSECQKDVSLCIKNRGTTPVRLLSKLGVLNSSWNLIHAVAIDREEIDIVAKNNASIIHCPVSNAKTGAGIAPIGQLLASGVNIALGTDACSNNNTNNILNEAYFASLLYSAKNNDPKTLSIDTIFKWLTINGYRMLGKNQSGEITGGEPADLLLWELGKSSFVPICYGNFYSSIIYNAPDIKPHTVFIDGEKIVENYCFTKFDEKEVQQKSNVCAYKIYYH
ncbi:MAG: 5-methylthioadenosine/S-adenosylhomocysteine deaminase [candidate division TM6 bacterium GW2011_GWF2_30_66]|nr:MAG: 5-methylthioadenosine/S-adenosylhomocysteine deaminase [candidate division TM6 bacterium GW2011_GWF2_30_66]